MKSRSHANRLSRRSFVGGTAALVFGIAAIWLFVRMLASRAFHYFSYYAWSVGGLFLAWLYVTA